MLRTVIRVAVLVLVVCLLWGIFSASTLVYRIFSWLLVVPFGGLAWLLWKRTLPDEEIVGRAPATGASD